MTRSRAGLQPAHELVHELLAAGQRPVCACRVCVIGQIPLHCPAYDQLRQRNGIWSQTGLRHASKLDNVMEYGLNRSAIRLELS